MADMRLSVFRQSVFGRLAGYEDVNDAERLRHDPAMNWIVGGKATSGCAASPSQMGRSETQWLAVEKNLSALTDLSGQWVCRKFRVRMDRCRPWSSSTKRYRARYGFERQPDARRTGEQRLERALRLHLLPSAAAKVVAFPIVGTLATWLYSTFYSTAVSTPKCNSDA
jgi:hypothetical protein